MAESTGKVRPTKKQRQLLDFISSFITEHGYSPSYREIMNGLQYNSVATVALHVNNLIRRGHLIKRDHSARSIEVVEDLSSSPVTQEPIPGVYKTAIDSMIEELTNNHDVSVTNDIQDRLNTIIESLKLVGLVAQAELYSQKLKDILASKSQ